LVNPSVGKQGAYDAAAAAGASTADAIGPLSMRIKCDESPPEPSASTPAVTTPRRTKRTSQQAALMEFLCKRQDLEERKMEFLLSRAKGGGWFYLFIIIFYIILINLMCMYMYIIYYVSYCLFIYLFC